jgi:predicted nuclease of predicted toxin-antitoxin system
MLRFLADESCDFAAVRALRGEGFDVLSVAEVDPGSDDERVIELATRDNRILLTEDKDFGQLVFAAGRETVGVVLIRFAARARSSIGSRVVELVRTHPDRLVGSFVVLQPDRTRISTLPLREPQDHGAQVDGGDDDEPR